MQTTVYSMTRNGGMEVNNGRPVLPIGCKLFSYGAGMSETDAVVISEPDERTGSQRYVTLSRYPERQRFGTIDKYAKPISKKFGIGTYYDDSMTVAYTQADIDAAVNAATQAQADRDAAAKAKAEAYAAEKAAMPSLHPYLKPITGNGYDKNGKAERKANLVAALRHHFPDTFFSIRNDHGRTYNIRWENGATDKAVTEVLNQFKDSYFDGMSDSTVHYDNAFADVFGSFDYLFTHRDMSKEIQDIMKETETDDRWDNRIYTAFREQTFPPAAKITGFDKVTNTFTFVTPDVVAKAEGKSGSLTVKHYSDKSFIVEGDTYEIRAQMKSLGGVWLRHVKAWCYSYKKLDQVKSTLGIVDDAPGSQIVRG